MRTAILFVGLLLTASLVALATPASALAAGLDAERGADAEASLLWGCDGVTLRGDFTGHCGNACNGRVYVQGNPFAEHVCVQPLCDLLCSPPVASTDSAASLLGGCDGVEVAGSFTGHCGDACRGRVYVDGTRQAEHRCVDELCEFLCSSAERDGMVRFA